MINRELIRLKVVQVIYAYYGNGDKSIDEAEKELIFSLSKAYELYQELLLLLLSIAHIGQRMVEMKQNRAIRLNEEGTVSTKFVRNRFIALLRSNEQLSAYREKQNVLWSENEEFLRRIYTQITEQDFYKEYMADTNDSYEQDRELWRKIYRNILCNNEELDDILEDSSLYWNDDKAIVDTFVLKTIRQLEESKGSGQKLLPDFKDVADREFAVVLFRTSLKNADYYRQLIAAQTLNWDMERIARMDLILIQTALAEITSFPEIPLSVTINEYVEIAKSYSTPRSGSYVNGMLDTIGKRLIAEGKIGEK